MAWARLTYIRHDKEHPAPPLGEQEDEEDRGRGGRTTSKSGQTWTSQRYKGRQTTGSNGDSWLQGHRWCPNDTTVYRIDDDDDIIIYYYMGEWETIF